MSDRAQRFDKPEFPPWPGDWPDRRFVDLDNVGDPGGWLEMKLPSVEEVLMQNPEEYEEAAKILADAYIRKSEELCFPLRTDFEGPSEPPREETIADFVGCIREWRRRAKVAGCFKPEKIDPNNSVATWQLLPGLGF